MWEWVIEELTTEELSNKLFFKDDNQKKFWHVTEMMGNKESLDKLWTCTKVNLIADEIKK